MQARDTARQRGGVVRALLGTYHGKCGAGTGEDANVCSCAFYGKWHAGSEIVLHRDNSTHKVRALAWAMLACYYSDAFFLLICYPSIPPSTQAAARRRTVALVCSDTMSGMVRKLRTRLPPTIGPHSKGPAEKSIKAKRLDETQLSTMQSSCSAVAHLSEERCSLPTSAVVI